MSNEAGGARGWRRLRGRRGAALVAALVVVVAVGVVLAFTRHDTPSEGMTACRAVVDALDDANRGKRSPASVLDVVRRQEPRARAAADRDPSFRGVADAITQLEADLEAGRPSPGVIVLYNRCGP